MPDKYSSFRSFVIQNNPNISKDQLNQLDEFVYTQQATDMARQGVDPSILSNPSLVNVYAQAGVNPPSKNAADAQLPERQRAALSSLEPAIQNLEAARADLPPRAIRWLMDLNKGGREWIPSLRELFGNAPMAKYESAQNQLVNPIARGLWGETGPLATQEREMAKEQAPGMMTTQAEYEGLIDQLRTQAANMQGGGYSPQAIDYAMGQQSYQQPIILVAPDGYTQIQYDDPNDPEIQQAMQAGYQPIQ